MAQNKTSHLPEWNWLPFATTIAINKKGAATENIFIFRMDFSSAISCLQTCKFFEISSILYERTLQQNYMP